MTRRLTEPERLERLAKAANWQPMDGATLEQSLETLNALLGTVGPDLYKRLDARVLLLLGLDRYVYDRQLADEALKVRPNNLKLRWHRSRLPDAESARAELEAEVAAHDEETKEQRIAWVAQRERRVAELQAEEDEELARHQMATVLIDSELEQMPVVKKFRTKIKKVVAPKQVKRERKEKIERKAGSYLGRATRESMGQEAFNQYLHDREFGRDDEDLPRIS